MSQLAAGRLTPPSDEACLVQALRLRLRRLQLELGEVRELQVCAERQAEEYHVQGEGLEEMRRCHVQETQRLARQRRLELRQQATLRAQLAEVQQALRATERCSSDVPWQVHRALQRQVLEAKDQLQQLQGRREELQKEVREAQAKPPPKTQDLPRPAWVGDRPMMRKDTMSSPRTPSTDGSILSKQVGATDHLRSEVAQVQESLRRELRRQKALQGREEVLQKRQRQLEAALKQSRAAQATEMNSMHSELQEGAHHVQRLRDFAMQAPGVTALQQSDGGSSLQALRSPEARKF
eukprot:symbB.v1.2.006102.t1/scaffold359.1/size220467/12